MSGNGIGGALAVAGRVWRAGITPIFCGCALAICATIIGFYSPYNQSDYAAYRASKAKEQIPELSSEDRKRETDETIAFYTLWLMLFTGVLAVSTVGLWVVTWRGATNQARDMRDSLNISRQSVLAVMTAERAHVLVHAPVLAMLVNPATGRTHNPPEGLAIRYELMNFGKGPAFIKIGGIKAVVDVGLPPEPDYIAHLDERSILVVPPNDKIVIHESFEVTAEEWHDGTTESSGKGLFICGFLTYEDQFRAEHTAGFAFRLSSRRDETGAMVFYPVGPKAHWHYT